MAAAAESGAEKKGERKTDEQQNNIWKSFESEKETPKKQQ